MSLSVNDKSIAMHDMDFDVFYSMEKMKTIRHSIKSRRESNSFHFLINVKLESFHIGYNG